MAKLYEVVLQQSYFDQEVINRWNYLGTGTPAGISPSLALLIAMGFIADGGVFPSPTVFSRLRAEQHTTLFYRQVTAKAVYVPTDFYDTPFTAGLAGTAGDQPSAPFISVGVFSNRVRTDIGRGYKRFAGIPEADQGDGGVLTVGALDRVQDIADAMSAVLTYDDEGSMLTFSPVIVQKEEYTTPSGKKAYRYYSTEVAQADHLAEGITWQPYTTVRSKVSRQYGRGA